jgi:hypothetical protein
MSLIISNIACHLKCPVTSDNIERYFQTCLLFRLWLYIQSPYVFTAESLVKHRDNLRVFPVLAKQDETPLSCMGRGSSAQAGEELSVLQSFELGAA